MPNAFDQEHILSLLFSKLPVHLPELLGVYAFGSRIQGVFKADSDLDLAILVAGKADPLILWDIAQQMAITLDYDVDLLDMRVASTVMQYQILSTGRRIWAKDDQAAIYESFILSEKTALDEWRAGLVSDIEQRRSVYGR